MRNLRRSSRNLIPRDPYTLGTPVPLVERTNVTQPPVSESNVQGSPEASASLGAILGEASISIPPLSNDLAAEAILEVGNGSADTNSSVQAICAFIAPYRHLMVIELVY